MSNFKMLCRSARTFLFVVAFSGGILLSGCQADTLTGIDTTIEADGNNGGGTSTTDQHNEGHKNGGGTSTTDQHNEG